MAICELYLIALVPGCTIAQFLSTLRQHGVRLLAQAHVLRWVILPKSLSAAPLLAHNIHWDLVVILDAGASLPSAALSQITASWSAATGIPSALVKGYASTNADLLRSPSGSVGPAHVPSGSASSAQKLQLSNDLIDYVQALGLDLRSHPVSMLNLLAFNPNKKQDYIKYGKEFSAKVGSKHGGKVKLVGHVVGKQAKEEGWDEIAFVHYPTLNHFAAMLGDKNYQEVNEKYRLGALKDTFILCTIEIDDMGNPAGGQKRIARL